MPKSSSTSSFKKLPVAALLAVLLIGVADYVVSSCVEAGIIRTPVFMNAYKIRMADVKKRYRQESVILLGNSRALGIPPHILAQSLFGTSVHEVFSLSAGGAMPKTHEQMLDYFDYRCIQNGNTAILCLTPMCFNRFNTCFDRTIMNFFSWPHFFTELLPALRGKDIRYFIGNGSLHLLKYRTQLNALIKPFLFGMRTSACLASLDPALPALKKEKADPHKVNPRNVEFVKMNFETEYYVDYTIDPYQIAAVQETCDQVEKRGGHMVLVKMPLSDSLRTIISPEDLQQFSKEVDALAEKNRLPLLDYLDGFTGTEYEYYDGSHLTISSGRQFTETLAADLLKLSDKKGFPRVVIDEKKQNRSLTADPTAFPSGKGGILSFDLSVGPAYAGRKYLILGSCSGTVPGIMLPSSLFTIPINMDFFTHILLQVHRTPFFKNFSGTLDDQGKARASVEIPHEVSQSFEGHSVWFAYLLYAPRNFTSNAVRVDFVSQ